MALTNSCLAAIVVALALSSGACPETSSPAGDIGPWQDTLDVPEPEDTADDGDIAATTDTADAAQAEDAEASVSPCETGETLCHGVCVDVLADDDHCGTCDARCDTPAGCVDGRCLRRLAYVLYAEIPHFMEPTTPRLEVVDLGDGSLVGEVELVASASGLALSSDGRTAFVANYSGVKKLDLTDFEVTAELKRDGNGPLVLSPDDTTLYLARSDALLEIDIETWTVTRTLDPRPSRITSIAISPDGATLLVASDGLRDGLVDFVSTSSFAVIASAPVASVVSGCAVSLSDALVTPDGRGLIWDPNCDVLHQFDLATGTHDASAVITTGRDSGVFFATAIAYDPVTARAYVAKEDGNIVSLDPVEGTFTAAPVVSAGQPLLVSLAPQGGALYVVAGGNPRELHHVSLPELESVEVALTLDPKGVVAALTVRDH